MKNSLATFLVCITALYNPVVYGDYALGCDDPEYHRYIQNQFNHFEKKSRRLHLDTLRDYERSVATNQNPYQIIGNLSRHLKYSAQFDPIDTVTIKIDRIFEYAEALSIEQKIAGDVIDSFSSETHAVGIARAWIAYRRGLNAVAFRELLESIEMGNSAMLSAFGPDFELVRQLYRDGHVRPVIDYLNKTETFWQGKRPDNLRYVWRKMIEAKCKVQFDFMDTIKALELGLSVINVNKDYGLGG